jgi:hypothetical protein
MYTWYLFYHVELSNFVYNFIQVSFVLHFVLLFKERFSSKWLKLASFGFFSSIIQMFNFYFILLCLLRHVILSLLIK